MNMKNDKRASSNSKYSWSKCDTIPFDEYHPLESWRKKLFTLRLIGTNKETGRDLGNVSIVQNYSHLFRSNVPQFLIAGAQTGEHPDLNGDYYTRILDYDGQSIVASGCSVENLEEVMLHGSIYSHNQNIKAIFHIHSEKIYQKINDDDFSDLEEIQIGICRHTQNKNSGAIRVSGDHDGIIIYASELDEAGSIMENICIYKKYH